MEDVGGIDRSERLGNNCLQLIDMVAEETWHAM